MGKTWKDRPELDRPIGKHDTILVMDGEDGGIVKWLHASLFRGPGVKEIQKTDSDGLKDIYTIFYDDGSTFNFHVLNGERGIPKAWMGEFSIKINYPAEVGFSYKGSSYFTLKECIGVEPPNEEYYGVLAERGNDGKNGKDGEVIGGGDMKEAEYNPKGVKKQIAFEEEVIDLNNKIPNKNEIISSIGGKITIGEKEYELKHINNVIECELATYEALYIGGLLDEEPYKDMYYIVEKGEKFLGKLEGQSIGEVSIPAGTELILIVAHQSGLAGYGGVYTDLEGTITRQKTSCLLKAGSRYISNNGVKINADFNKMTLKSEMIGNGTSTFDFYFYQN